MSTVRLPGPEGAPLVLPLFPLTGSLLLPGGLLPLHIFEPRYRHMVEDVLADHRIIGMVQPTVPDPADNRGSGPGTGAGSRAQDPRPRSAGGQPEVYDIGCAGKIEKHQELPQGRYVIVLRGLGRFRIERELELCRGYRQVEVSYDPFVHDPLDLESEIEGDGILAALTSYAVSRGLELDLEQLEGLAGLALLNGLAMTLPFTPAEKQALLEAADVGSRRDILLALLTMGFETPSDLTN